ncbi:tetratricopeptide repeat protein [Cytophagaceae bacterium ABcell3]|nr:tetratricopeptide repeat protein [Cytophagaceae bacterium ABcell3]
MSFNNIEIKMNLIRCIAIVGLFSVLCSCGGNQATHERKSPEKIASDPILHALNNAVSENPNNIKFLIRRGAYLFEAGMLKKALQDAVQASEKDDRSFDAWFLRAKCLEELGQYPEALESAFYAERIKDNRAELMFLLAKLTLLTGNTIKSDQYLFKASRMAPEHSDIYLIKGMTAIAAKDTARGLRILRKGYNEDPSNKGVVRQLARTYNHAGKSDSAMIFVIAGQNYHPEDPSLLFAKGQVLSKSGFKESALYAFQSSLKFNPDYMPANRKLGEYYFKSGNLAGSKIYLEKVLEQDTALADINLMLARVYEREVQNEEAIKLYKRILSVNPEDTAAQLSLNRIYNRFPDLAPVEKQVSLEEDEKPKKATSTTLPAPSSEKAPVEAGDKKKEVPLQPEVKKEQESGKDTAGKAPVKKDSLKAAPKAPASEQDVTEDQEKQDEKTGKADKKEKDDKKEEVADDEDESDEDEGKEKKRKGLFRRK